LRYDLFLAELKRRKVFRVAAVYGATAFVLLQAADIVFPSLGLPRWTLTLVVALALIGFPMALVLAWTFEASADGVKRTAPADHAELAAIAAQPRSRRYPAGIAALLGILLLAGGTAWVLGYRGGTRSARYDSIAVLPFANLSGSADNEYFGDGLAEELLNALAGIEGLKVAARTSSFAFKGSNIDVRTIGDTLGVATVLEGSVRRSADRIRITAQLIDARTGYHLWSQSYDRPLTDLFAVQDAIAREISGALAGRFTTSKEEDLYRGGTKDVQAYDLYLLGRQKWVTRKVPLLREAIGHFEQAIARDSSFALAWSGLADAIDALAWRSADGRSLVPQGKYAAQRALMLDPELAEAWASVGVLALDMDRDFRLAELGLRRAIALKPSYASPYNWLADALRFSGRVEESIEAGERGLELDPVSGLGMNGMLQSYLILGRDQEARAMADRMISIGFTDLGTLVNFLSAGVRLGFTAQELKQFAIDWARIRGYSKPDEAGVIGLAVRDQTLRPQALAVLRRMTADRINAPNVAELCIALGDAELAISNILRAVEENDPTIVVIGTDRIYDPLRKDARFIRALQQLNLPNGFQPTSN
jgi:TolB-like protein